ncbi:MAG: dihydrofolate reductase [Pirellulaceae bacterium]|jgi:dihydrofolate reductase
MIIISAMSENRVIGSGDGMPWSVPKEYEQYLRFVSGNVVVLGRKSYEIFGPDLPTGTKAIVLTRSTSVDGAEAAPSLADALEMANGMGPTVFVAGGGSVYEQAIPLADEMYLSTIKGEFDGDTYFPAFNVEEWEIVEERDEVDFVFRRYRRK